MDDEDKNYNLNAEKEVDDSSIYSLKTDKLKNAMERLEPKDKMIILMKYQDEIPIKEIKELLEIGESAVKMRLKRAKAKLIELYNDL
jgi:RNA polymerase sigma-70 factor (ECF subfamily)